MKKQFIDPVLDIKSFMSKHETRAAYDMVFKRSLVTWKGNLTKCLIGSLADKIT